MIDLLAEIDWCSDSDADDDESSYKGFDGGTEIDEELEDDAG